MKDLIIKKCLKCGAMVKIIEDCHCDNCGIKCCNEQMKEIKKNSTDGAIEKHKPTYVKEDNKIIVTINHVMDEDHYIEWICLLTEDREEYVYFNFKDDPKAIFNNVKHGKIYSYCNKHGLWETDIEWAKLILFIN